MSRKRPGERQWRSLWPWIGTALLSAQALAAESTASPPNTQDLQLLLRTGQLAEWFGQPITLAEGLCIQSRYTLFWPDAAKGPATNLQEDALRLAREYCTAMATELEMPLASSLRLVTEAKAAFRARLLRVHGLRLAIQACRDEGANSVKRDECLRLVH